MIDIDALSDRELDAMIAEHVMQCKIFWEKHASGNKPRCDCPGANSAMIRPHGNNLWGYIKSYSANHTAAYEMEEEIKRRGLEIKYSYCLSCIVFDGMETHKMTMYSKYWLIAHATPKQRCRAALRVVMGNN